MGSHGSWKSCKIFRFGEKNSKSGKFLKEVQVFENHCLFASKVGQTREQAIAGPETQPGNRVKDLFLEDFKVIGVIGRVLQTV